MASSVTICRFAFSLQFWTKKSVLNFADRRLELDFFSCLPLLPLLLLASFYNCGRKKQKRAGEKVCLFFYGCGYFLISTKVRKENQSEIVWLGMCRTHFVLVVLECFQIDISFVTESSGG